MIQSLQKKELIHSKKASRRAVLFFLSAYFILWFLLFEFILPVNEILPKPSVVLLSFPDLWSLYKLPLNYFLTVGIIYFSFTAAYFVLKISAPLLIKRRNILTNFILSLKWFSDYVPGVVLGLFLIFWFPYSQFIEFVFSFLAVFILLVIKFSSLIEKINKAYIDSAYSLGMSESDIIKKVIWKSLQPDLIKYIFNINLYIWTIVIAFEFFKGSGGIGNILRIALEFNDLSALFSTALVTGITIWLFSFLIKYIEKKFFFWNGIEK